MKIYTKMGDRGQTSLVEGSKRSKSDLRLSAYGTVDELNSHVGLLISFLCLESPKPEKPKPESSKLFSREIEFLKQVQIWLFHLGSLLSCSENDFLKKLPSLTSAETENIETFIDALQFQMPELKNFILPGGHQGASQAHICRTLARRAERICVTLNEKTELQYPALPFLNRLGDFFFVLARFVNHSLGIKDTDWVHKT